jgi:signal transduction histidine kinase
MKKVVIVLTCIILIFLLVVPFVSAKSSIDDKGVFSIHEIDQDDLFKLDGEWEFYWKELLTPEEFDDVSNKFDAEMVKVPNTWSNYSIKGEKLPNSGYATYKVQIELPASEVGSMKAIYVPNISSAYRIWINGIEQGSKGIVGNNRENMKPDIGTNVIVFQVNDSTIEVVVQVSNFHQRKAGIYDSFILGEPDTIQTFKERKIVYRTVIIISLLTMGLYHLILFFYRRKQVTSLLFGATCMFVSIRAVILEEGLTSYFLFYLNWEIISKLEYLGASLGLLCFALFTYFQYLHDMSKKFLKVIIWIISLYSFFVIVTKGIVFTRTLYLFEAIVVFVFLYLIYVYLLAFIRKRNGSKLNLVAIILFFISILNDVLYFNQIIQTFETTSLGLLIFLFVQSLSLAKQYTLTLQYNENLSRELMELNTSLEQQVQERTKELHRTNQELRKANQELEELHATRSKWLKDISHEISTPLTGIRAYTKGMLDKVVPKEDQYIQIAYDQSVYLSKLLEDLHVMADMEDKQANFHLKPTAIRPFIKKLYEKYKWNIQQEGIQFYLYDSLPMDASEVEINMDETRIEQVIVNLLNNARRFVERNGKISIELSKLNEDYIEIKVIDNGLGIKESELTKIFERFYRSSKQGKNHSGFGLGLSIVKEIIEYHGGEINVTSKEGQGTCFSFTLPIIQGE